MEAIIIVGLMAVLLVVMELWEHQNHKKKKLEGRNSSLNNQLERKRRITKNQPWFRGDFKSEIDEINNNIDALKQSKKDLEN